MDHLYTVKNSAAITTPSLLFYKNLVQKNIDTAISIAGDPTRLRPHVKTHKTREIVQMQMKSGIEKFKCATIAEAEMLALCGARDILLAYPLVGPNITRFISLKKEYPETQFKALVENLVSTEQLSAAAQAAKLTVDVFMDIDPGLHRTGVEPGEEAFSLYRKIASSENLVPAGIHCYDGQNHQSDKDERTSAARECYTENMKLKERLEKAGLPVAEVILGGTPTFPMYAAFPEVVLSPGTCFLNDWGYSSSYKDMNFSCAALILSRVISVNTSEQTFTLDLGVKGIASDPKGVRGIILNIENTQSLYQNEEHWVFRTSGELLPVIGSEVYILPTHICPSSALYAEVCIIDNEGFWSESWKIAARDRKLSI